MVLTAFMALRRKQDSHAESRSRAPTPSAEPLPRGLAACRRGEAPWRSGDRELRHAQPDVALAAGRLARSAQSCRAGRSSSGSRSRASTRADVRRARRSRPPPRGSSDRVPPPARCSWRHRTVTTTRRVFASPRTSSTSERPSVWRRGWTVREPVHPEVPAAAPVPPQGRVRRPDLLRPSLNRRSIRADLASRSPRTSSPIAVRIP